jgi:outer membrane protein assembly factor BamB
MTRKWTFLGAVLCAGLPAAAWSADWPQFRGPNGSAVSAEKNLPAEWSADANVAWKAQTPGYGWSCPVVAGDKVFVTTAATDNQKKPASGFGPGSFGPGAGRPGFGPGMGRPPNDVYKWEVYCLSASDGKVLWHQTAAEHKPTIPIQASNTYATETPVTDGERVYAYFGMTGVYCYDLDGNQVWKKDLGSYRMMMGYGTGGSPTLDGDRLFIQCDNDEKSFLIALNKKTGEELWRTDRPEGSTWSTPLVWKNKVRTEIVCLGSRKVRSYDPETGKQLWELGGMSGQVHASPVASEDLLYVGTGGGFAPGRGFGPGSSGPGAGGKPLFAVKAGASGDITLKGDATSNDGVAWFLPQAGPPMASPLLYDGYLYILEQRGGQLSCYDAKTGDRVYRERLPGATGCTSSPWAYDGKVFCLADDGRTYVVQAGKDFKVLGKNDLDSMCYSSPAVAGGALFLRTVDSLYCIRNKQ